MVESAADPKHHQGAFASGAIVELAYEVQM
jgi:hypothetical protein